MDWSYQLIREILSSDKPSILRLIDSSQPETVVQQLSLPEGVLMDTTWQASDSGWFVWSETLSQLCLL